MRCRNQHAAPGIQVGKHGLCQCAAFLRIGARPQLVQQYKRMRACVFYGKNDALHVRGKCRERLLNALFVADIGIESVKNRQLGRGFGWQEQTGLGHCAKQPHQLQRNRFTACIGPGDNQRGNAPVHCDSDRHNLVAADQRVAAFRYADDMIMIECHRMRVHLARQRCFCKYHIKLHEYFCIGYQRIAHRGRGGRKFIQYFCDFGSLGAFQFAYAVVGFHDALRLDE